MIPVVRTALAAVLVLALAAPARAGIVNLTSILSSDAPEGVSGSVTGSADWRTGNTELLLLSAAPIARYKAGRHLGIGILNGALGRSGGADIIKNAFAHVRYRYQIVPRVLGETFAQYSFDEFKNLEIRALVGAGPKFDVILRKEFEVAVGVAYMLEFERADLPDVDDDLAHRASSYVNVRVKANTTVDFVETAYVQPRLTDFSDTRLLSDTSLVVKLTKDISLTNTLSIAYDSEPIGDVEELDTALKTSISIGF